MSDTPLPGPLEDFLQHPPTKQVDVKLQAALAEQTAALLPRSRMRPRWPVIAAAAAIVLALISAYFVWRRDPPPTPAIVEQKTVPQPDQPPPKADDKPTPPVVMKTSTNPLELENLAFDAEDDPQRVRLYFQAGDLYLDRHQDVASAMRCYRQALTYCDSRQREVDSADNWLVMTLKNDFHKEN